MTQKMKNLILCATCLAGGGALSLAIASGLRADTPAADAPAGSSSGLPRTINQDDFTRAAEETVNGVVSVKSYVFARSGRGSGSRQQYEEYIDPFEFFFGQPRSRKQYRDYEDEEESQAQPQQSGLGSGVIITPDGYIVTNNHVIADAERLEVTLNDNRNYEATVVGSDATTDLALIKIEVPEGESLHVIPMGNSEALHLGEWVLAVGNPFGFTSTVTSGIVSAKARNISTTTGTPSQGGIESYIQTDAAVNRGNSGGALVNLRGELVGINTAIYSQTGTYAGCSFAIPTSIVQKVVNDLKEFGTVQRAYLGIRFIELSPELIQRKNIKGATRGIYVDSVEERSAAREAGLQEGDIIVSINNYITGSTAELQETITKFSPGDEITVAFLREGEPRQVKVVLRNSSGTVDRVERRTTAKDGLAALGATFSNADEETCRRLEILGGVKVDSVESNGRLAKAGVREGLIILNVNNVRVKSADQLENIVKEVAKASARDRALFITGVYPSGKVGYFAVDLSEQ